MSSPVPIYNLQLYEETYLHIAFSFSTLPKTGLFHSTAFSPLSLWTIRLLTEICIISHGSEYISNTKLYSNHKHANSSSNATSLHTFHNHEHKHKSRVSTFYQPPTTKVPATRAMKKNNFPVLARFHMWWARFQNTDLQHSAIGASSAIYFTVTHTDRGDVLVSVFSR